jgi:D-alanine-D-alanine ligase
MYRVLSERAEARCLDESRPRADEIARLEECIDRLKSRLRLAVVFAGDKSAPGSVLYPSCNTRSWKSYEAVAADIAAALRRVGFRHVHLMPDDMQLSDRLRRAGIHLAWLNTGGVQGYNPAAHASAMLEMLGVPYVGHDPLTASTLDNKHAFKREALCAGLPTAPFTTWHMARGPFRPELNSRFQLAFGDYAGPFVVKPVSGRASLHVHVVDDRAALPDVVAEIYRETENLVLIEKYLAGREFCIAVAGPVTAREQRLARGRDPFTFAAVERLLSSDERIFTSMDVRPITTDRCVALDRERDARELDQLRRLACEVFLEFNLSSLVRLDVRSDEKGQLYILEANPKPDLKKPANGVTSLISIGLPELGMDYDDLILSLLADRLDFLFSHRAAGVKHIADLLKSRAPSASATATDAFQQVTRQTAAVERRAAAVQLAAAAMGGADAGERLPHQLAEVAAEAGNRALGVALSAMSAAKGESAAGTDPSAAADAPAMTGSTGRGLEQGA